MQFKFKSINGFDQKKDIDLIKKYFYKKASEDVQDTTLHRRWEKYKEYEVQEVQDKESNSPT